MYQLSVYPALNVYKYLLKKSRVTIIFFGGGLCRVFPGYPEV